MTEHLPEPIVNPDSAPYWAAARDEKLKIQKCAECGTLRFFPRHLCTECGSDNTEWAEISGRGSVQSFTIVHRAAFPEFQAITPYVVALIDLEEGPRMMTNIVGDDALDVEIDDAGEVCFEDRGTEGAKVPQFRRAKG